MSKHTPGPWKILPMGISDEIGAHKEIVDARNVPVADVYHRAFTRSSKERDANARLIVAAPELLETIELALTAAKEIKRWSSPDLSMNLAAELEIICKQAITNAIGENHE